MPRKTKFRAVIVGTGRVAGGLENDPLREHPCTHAGIYNACQDIELIACSGIDKNQVFEFAKVFNIPRIYTCHKKMFKKEKPDIVSVCTPATFHAPITIEAARFNAKLVFCEKPIATSLKEASKMIQVCRKNKTVLVVNHLRRWGWDYDSVKVLLEAGEIGAIQSVSAYFSGNIMHTGTHMFDMFRFLFGEVVSVRGKTGNGDPDPEVSGVLEFESGLEVFVNGKAKDFFIFEVDIMGSRGRIRIGNHLLELWKPVDSKHYSSFVDLEKRPFPFPVKRPNPWSFALEDMVDCLSSGKLSRSTGEDAFKAMEIGFGLIVSSRKKGEKVGFPLKNCRLRVLCK